MHGGLHICRDAWLPLFAIAQSAAQGRSNAMDTAFAIALRLSLGHGGARFNA